MVKKAEIVYSTLWIIIGTFAMIVSFKMGLGNIQNPGAGFTPFIFSFFLIALSLLNLTVSFVAENKRNGRTDLVFAPPVYKKLGIMVGSLFFYGVFVETIGFLITTFLVMTLLFQTAGCKWITSIIGGLIITFVSFFLFSFLGVMLPQGITRF